MADLTVTTSLGSFPVEIAVGSARSVTDAAVVVLDPVIAGVLPGQPEKQIEVTGSEESRTLAACERVLLELDQHGVRREDVIAVAGGGVVQDVATLSASLYLGGVPWVYFPTTLMSMVDTCIDGKSSIDAAGIANSAGTFYPPSRVVIDPTFVKALSARELTGGMAEAVKICFARGRESLETFLGLEGIRRPGPNPQTVELIQHVLEAKKWFVEIDELDQNERQLLNFGHSFAHAWEAASGFAVQHGVAVAVGMMAALRHPASEHSEDVQLLDDFCLDILTPVAEELAAAAEATDWGLFRVALRSDAKNTATSLRLILPADGSVAIREFPLDEEQLSIAERAIKDALEEAAPAS